MEKHKPSRTCNFTNKGGEGIHSVCCVVLLFLNVGGDLEVFSYSAPNKVGNRINLKGAPFH